MTVTSTDRLTTDEILHLNREFTFFSWSAQAKINPIVIDRAEGVYFWDPDGKRYLDFNSQLMSVNIGHGNQRVADAIAAQAHKLAYATPRSRPRRAAGWASSCRGHARRPRRSSSPSVARRPTRTPSSWRACSRGARR